MLINLLIYFLTALFIKLFTKRFTFSAPEYRINNIKKSVIQSFIIVAADIILIIVYILSLKNYLRSASESMILLIQSAYYIFTFAIVVIVVLHNKEGLKSIGIMKSNLLKSCLLGLFLGIVFTVISQATPGFKYVNILTIRSLIVFFVFLILGISEEIMYRGYFQTRLIAWQGTVKGCLLASVIFSFIHFPNNLILQNMSLEDALISCINIIPLSLLLGYLLFKTKNIASVAILHAIIDWSGTLFRA